MNPIFGRYPTVKDYRAAHNIPNSVKGLNLVEYRIKHQLTQNQIAETIGYDKNTIARWERGVLIPGRKALHIIEEKLKGTNPDRIYRECLDKMSD